MKFNKRELDVLLSCIEYAYNPNLLETDKWEVDRNKLFEKIRQEKIKLNKRLINNGNK